MQDESIRAVVGAIAQAGLMAVRIEERLDDESQSGQMSFMGTLTEFIATAKHLGANALFWSSELLDEDFFTDQVSEDENAEPDLTVIEPKLKKYQPHVGQVLEFKLWMQLPHIKMSFLHRPEWATAFIDLRDAVLDALEAKRDQRKVDTDAAQLKMRKAGAEKTARLIAELNSLSGDPLFVKLGTQATRLAYALKKIPDLRSIHEFKLKAEISRISAELKAAAALGQQTLLTLSS